MLRAIMDISARSIFRRYYQHLEINKCIGRSESVPTYGPAILGVVSRSGDAVSKLDWACDDTERLETFTSAKDRHVAIVEHATKD
jgi:hypothetical protein